MINRNKGKFTRSIQHIEVEYGAKHSLMQVKGDNEQLAEINKAFQEASEKNKAYRYELQRATNRADKTHYQNLILETDKAIIEAVKLLGDRVIDNGFGKFGEPKYGEPMSISSLKGDKIAIEMSLRATTNADERDFYKKEIELYEKGLNDIAINNIKQKKAEAINKQNNFAITDAAYQQRIAAKIASDPLELDANELKAYELINKTGILKDLEGFKTKIASGDKEAVKDARELEKALRKDGKSLTADGVINQKTIDAAKALIGENADAILKYEKVMSNISVSPNAVTSRLETDPILKK